MKKKILIVGSSANTYSLAKYFCTRENDFEVFVAPGNELVSEFATRVDIREDDISELLKFAITNDINFLEGKGIGKSMNVNKYEDGKANFISKKSYVSYLLSKEQEDNLDHNRTTYFNKFGLKEY